MNLLPLLVALAAALIVVLGCYGLHLSLSKTRVPVDEPTARPTIKSDETFFLHRITEAIGRPFTGTILASLTDKRRRSVHERIEASGRVDGLTVERYVQRKAGEVTLYGSLSVLLFLSDNALFGLVMLAFVGLTDLSMYVKAQERADQVQSQLPDFLDVLAVTVSAGMSFRAAVGRVADSMPGVLAGEFVIALRQMELGTSRREAFDALRRRNRNESLSKFVTAIQQAEELGAPLSDTLVNISQDMRRADAQYMRRKAQQLNPRVTVVTATTLLPGLLILIVGSMILGSDIDFGLLLGG
ncbi:type II secretion system F family protein [Nocardiopsis sp. JB363]|uniref:type II secretion system F family protein n=1 Tax=Nocardiopsis sp. JB363 TaxID=1434837 RepID=UPI00097AE5A5|nr:type II secretion system F family protein [Nocardiopsis sp. JB363]SIO87600.1 Type II/IV secretion system protein TadC, associated with Flp pilus assembly [Nocardiopsis sp. JB363]